VFLATIRKSSELSGVAQCYMILPKDQLGLRKTNQNVRNVPQLKAVN